MTLYEMLDKAMYYQQTWIFENNAYDQNMPLFKGTVDGARKDTDYVWDYLMHEVEFYRTEYAVLDIRVRSKNYEERFEDHYCFSDQWGAIKDKRPWRSSCEIDQEKGIFYAETKENAIS